VLDGDVAKLFEIPSRLAEFLSDVGEAFDFGFGEKQAAMGLGELGGLSLDLPGEHAGFVALT
jgi:hypothetical protein